MDAHCRIGKITFRSGAEMRLLPNARERTTALVFSDLDRTLGHVRRIYAGDLGGFILISWKHDGAFNSFVNVQTDYPTRNTLPEYVAEVMRRDNATQDAEDLLKHRLGL